MTEAELQELKQYINSYNWIRAKTYEKIAPHEYMVNPEYPNRINDLFKKYFDENSIMEWFTIEGKKIKQYPYSYLDGYKYWNMEYSVSGIVKGVVNRVKSK